MSKSQKILYIDYEFNRIIEPKVNLVCCATFCQETGEKKKWWLHRDYNNQEALCAYLSNFDIIIAYSAIAEARSYLAMDFDPLDFNWIDLFLEYRCITNNNDKMQWGEQLVDGKVTKVNKPRPKWEREEGEKQNSFRATHSLAEATYKLTGQIRDTTEKTRMRDLIISDPKEFSVKEKEEIMNYCLDDVVFLPEIHQKINQEYQRLNKRIDMDELLEEQFTRGRFAVHTAKMENDGYAIDIEKTKNFSNQVGSILYDCQREINELFPEIKPFRWDKKDQKFKWNQIATREWVTKWMAENSQTKKWKLTDGKQLSLALEAFTEFFDYKHDYPKDSFGAQMVRFLKLKQTLYGFVPSPDKSKKTFWSSVGSDGRVRPYTNIYGAQSSRSQPASTGFMFLKPAWMRSLVIPPPGKAMAGIDYGSEEFFLSAILSCDKNMIDAYLSGDPYLAFGKLVGMIPKDGTKETHGPERNLCKATTLGLSYLMSKFGLAIKLTQDTGKIWTEDEAEEMRLKFYEAFDKLGNYQEWIMDDYNNWGHIKLPCGWYCWGDNENFRSVSNLPIQGMGASILRKAVDLAVMRGLKVSWTLHDAIYIEYDIGEEYKIAILRDCMREAFEFYFDEEDKLIASKIKLDPFAWSKDYEKDSELDIDGWKVEASNIYIDSRSGNDYLMFSKYFENPVTDLL